MVPGDAGRVGYFVLHVHTGGTGDGRTLRVVVEDLTTRDKRTFESANDFGAYLDAWAARASPDRAAEPNEPREPP
jgi:hypothetical protein